MKITASIDDGCASDIKIARLCKEYGIDCTFYWPADFITVSIRGGWDYVTPKVEAYIADNFEIGSHGVTHAILTRVPKEQAKEEVEWSKVFLQNKYSRKIDKFCYPRGYADEEIINFVRKAGYTHARNTLIGHIGESEEPLFANTGVHIGCPVRKEYEGSTWLDYGKKLVEKAVSEDKDIEVWGHSWEIDKFGEWDNVREFFKFISEAQYG